MGGGSDKGRSVKRRGSARAAARRWLLVAVISAALCALPLAVPALLDRRRPPPVQAIASAWHAKINIHSNEPAIRVELSGEVLRATPGDPARVPLLPAETVLRDWRVNGEPAVPVRSGGWFCAELKRPGQFTATARVLARPAFDRGEWRLPLARPEAVQSAVIIDSSETLEVDAPGHGGRVVGEPGRGTRGILTLMGPLPAQIRWREARPAPERTGMALVTPSVAWTIGDATLSANARLDVEILDAPLDRIGLVLPPDADEVRISGPHVRDWRRADRDVQVFLQGPRMGRTPVSVSFVMKRAAGTSLVACPEIEVSGGRLDAGGWVLVARDVGGLLLEQETEGLRDVSDFDVPPPVLGLCRGRPMYLYARTARAARPVFDHVASSPFPLVETVADRADLLAVLRPDGEELVRADYTIRNHQAASLRLRLPAGARLLSVRVEGKACRPAQDGDSVRVPLARSIQTLNGLVPFPVEVIYCRQGIGWAGARSQVADFPELVDVPTAVGTATVLCPPEASIRGAEGAMKRVDRPAERGLAWFRPISRPAVSSGPPGGPALPPAAAAVTNALAYHYFRAGAEAYQGNKLEAAEAHLSRASALAGDHPLARHARDLLDNIRAGRGEVKGKDRAERAKVATIQEGIAAGNDALQAQQEMLISAGLANIDRGDETLGAELLNQADALGGQIRARHGSATRQESLGQKYKGKQRKADDDRRKNGSLQEKLAGLQKRSRELIRGWGRENDGAAKAQRFAAALDQAGAELGVDAVELNREVFGDARGESDIQPKSGLTEAARARTYSRQILAQASVNARSEPTGVRRDKGSLSGRNRDLEARVESLARAIQAANQAAAVGGETNRLAAARAAAREGTRQALEKVQEISRRLDSQSPGALDHSADEKRLGEIGNWAVANLTVYGAADVDLATGLKDLREKVERTRAAAGRAAEARKQAPTVVLDAAAIAGNATPAGQNTLVAFLGSNYAAGQPEAGPVVSLPNGKLEVRNADGAPEAMQSVLDNLRANDGQVAPVAGAEVGVSSLRTVPVVGGWFSNRLADGRRFAVLDEAQYRTLLALAATDPARHPASIGPAQREVVVGTSNRVAGEAFRLARSGADYNGFEVGGAEVELRHEQYLVIDNGTSAAVIKAGPLRNWQEEGAAVALTVAPERPISVPETGTALYFETTLLGAGESPDIRLML